jgi:ADP-heptose:LPS heptosyltransferase
MASGAVDEAGVRPSDDEEVELKPPLRGKQGAEANFAWPQGLDVLSDQTLKKASPVFALDNDDRPSLQDCGDELSAHPSIVGVPSLERQGRPPYRGAQMAGQSSLILFIAASRIGDAVLSSGLVKALIDEAPHARFTIVGGPLTAPLFAETPGLDDLIVMEKRPLGRHWLDLWRRVGKRRWDLVIDLRGSPISGFLKAERRAAYGRGPTRAHKVIEAARLLNLQNSPPAPHIFTSPGIELRADAITAGKRPILAIAPGANWVGKAWPPDRFALVAKCLLGPGGGLAGGRLMVVGGTDDQRIAETVKAAAPDSRRIDLVGGEDLLTCYAALKRVDLFIGNDSGLMHLAAAAGAPTLGLFGPSNDDLYAPWGGHCRVVRGGRSFDQLKRLDPGLRRPVCHMSDLPAEAVLAAASSLIGEIASEQLHARRL